MTSISLKEICTTNPMCVSQTAVLAEVLEMMAGHHISSVVVVEGKRPIGIFTERDALRIIPELLNPATTSISSVMSDVPVVAPLHLDLFEAYHLCAQKNLRHLIVVDSEGDLYGIATDSDFMKLLGFDVLSGQEIVENIMSLDICTLTKDDTLHDAIVLMVKSNASGIVITEADKPIGIITERDLVRLGRDHANSRVRLADVMSSPVISVHSQRSIYFAIERMREQQIRTLVVVNNQGMLEGLMTEHDVVKKIESHYVRMLNTIIKRQADDIVRIRKELDERHVLSAVLHESLGVSLIIADPEKNVRYLNPAASTLFGIAHENISGEQLELLFSKANMPVDHLLIALDKVQAGESYEYDLAHQIKGEIVELHVRMAPIQDQDNNLLGFVQTIQDETEKKHSERKLKQAASIFDNTIEGIIITDAKANILSVNPAFMKITGYAEDEVRGRNPSVLSSGRQDKAFYGRMWESLNASGYWQGELWNRRKSGETYAEWLTISAILDAKKQVKNYIAVFADITSSKLAHDEFEFLAHHDPLTKLPNRLLFNARLSHSLSRTKRTGDLVAVLMIDLDGFKLINDHYGHQAGDRVLEVVAERLIANTRGEDTVSRLGGDEFVVVLEDIAEQFGAMDVAYKLIESISQPIMLLESTVSVTASIGIALSSIAGDNPKILVASADDALYQAKSAGKNTAICAQTQS
ncbi:MAG: diguanylate cyclase [Methylotenera sp.]|nr:diguanylate cyclase [Methylotenera sp.]